MRDEFRAGEARHRRPRNDGDRYGDVELARNAGLRSAFVLSGYGLGEWEYQRARFAVEPDHVAEDLLDAVDWIIRTKRAR